MHPEQRRLHQVIAGSGEDFPATPAAQDHWVSVYLGTGETLPRVYTNRSHSQALPWWTANNGLVVAPGFATTDRSYQSQYLEPDANADAGFEVVSELTIPFLNERTGCKAALMCETYDADAFRGAWGGVQTDAVGELAERVATYLGFLGDQQPEVVIADDVLMAGDFHASALSVVTAVSDDILGQLRAAPEEVHAMSPREFEQLVARLMLDSGYKIWLTPEQKDGGRDVIAVKHGMAGPVLTLVECKKWSPQRPVPVEVVRGVYGILQQQRATNALVVTTSRFTRDAREFRDTIRYQLTLKDFDDVASWLGSHG